MLKGFEIREKDIYIFDKVVKDGTYILNGRIIKLEKGDRVHGS